MTLQWLSLVLRRSSLAILWNLSLDICRFIFSAYLQSRQIHDLLLVDLSCNACFSTFLANFLLIFLLGADFRWFWNASQVVFRANHLLLLFHLSGSCRIHGGDWYPLSGLLNSATFVHEWYCWVLGDRIFARAIVLLLLSAIVLGIVNLAAGL